MSSSATRLNASKPKHHHNNPAAMARAVLTGTPARAADTVLVLLEVMALHLVAMEPMKIAN